MGNLTSTLTVHLNDDVSGPAGKAAGALHKLGTSGNDLKKLASASPEAARLVKELERLKAASDKIAKFRDASRTLGAAGSEFRAARVDVNRLSADLVKAKTKLDAFRGVKGAQAEREGAASEVRKIERALRAANGMLEETKVAWRAQGVAVRTMRNELLSAGVELGAYNRKAGEVVGRGLNFTKAQADIAAATVRTNKALAHQSSLMESGARRAASAGASHRDVAAAMSSGDAGRQARERSSRRLVDGMGAPARAARERAEVEARHREKRATAGEDLANGMGDAGRTVAADIDARDRRAAASAEASRRMTDGMGAPARAAAREQAEAEVERERKRTARSADRRDAAVTVASAASLYGAHKGKEIGLEAINAAADMDGAVRYQHVVTDVSEADQQRLLIPQAKRIGQETQFSNRDIVEAQTATMQGLPFKDPAMKAEVGAAIVDQSRHYAVLFKASMESASEGIRSFLQNTNKDISTPEKAIKESTRATNLIVKGAKLGGMNNDDAQQFIKFGIPTATQAGFSDVTTMALGALARRSGLKGDEAGVFMRAASSKLISPTKQGREAEIMAGIDRSKYQKMPEQMSAEAFEKIGKGRFGVKFNEDQKKRLSSLFQDGDAISNREDFVAKSSAIVGDSFDKVTKGKNKGKVSAKDADKIAKLSNDFYKMSVESTDVEGLLREHMSSPKFTAALRNTFYTDKHGGKAGILANHFDQFASDRAELEHVTRTPEFASDRSKYMTEGLKGAVDNFKGSFETLILNIGTANKDLIKGTADTISGVADGVAGLPEKTVQVGTALTAVAASGASAASALSILGKLTGSASLSAGAAGIGALALPVLGAGAAAGVLYAGSDETRGLVHGGRPDIAINPGDELPGLSESAGKPSWVAPKIAPNRPPLTDGVPSLIDAPRKDTAGSIAKAREELAGYARELATLKSEMAGQSGLDLPGVGAGLESRGAELEALISGLQEKLRALGEAPVAPRVETAALDGLNTVAGTTQEKLTALGAITVSPKGDPSGLLSIEAVVDRISNKISALGAKIAGVASQASGVSVSDGPGGGNSGRVRQAAGNNH